VTTREISRDTNFSDSFPFQKNNCYSRSHCCRYSYVTVPCMRLPQDFHGTHESCSSLFTASGPTLDSCWPNSSSFCCRGVLSDSVSVISVLILPARQTDKHGRNIIPASISSRCSELMHRHIGRYRRSKHRNLLTFLNMTCHLLYVYFRL